MSNEKRPLYEIAADIRQKWAKVYFGAVPYLEALESMSQVADGYGLDSGESIVVYFLANAHSFRGPDARALKAELKSHL